VDETQVLPFALVVLAVGLFGATVVAFFGLRRRRARQAIRLPESRGKVEDLEPLLAPGEVLAWEGRPVGRPPLDRVRLLACLVGGFGALFLEAAFVTSVTRLTPVWTSTPKSTYTFSWVFVRVVASGPAKMASGASFPFTATWELPAPWITVAFVFVVLCAVDDLWRLAAWRARRYGITDRRVLAFDAHARTLEEVARPPDEVRLEKAALVVVARGKTLRFEGISDPEAARSALVPRDLPS
jgi:hypothetical protein